MAEKTREELAAEVHVLRGHITALEAMANAYTQTEAALRESEERYRAISEYSGKAICIVDEQAKISWCNDEMVAMGGYSREQVYGADSFVRFLAPESVEFVSSNFFKFVKHEPYEHHYQFYFIRADGAKRLCEKHMSDYTDKHGRRNLVITMGDITERRKLEEEMLKLQKLESVGLLAGGIAHDFNNVLTTILGSINMAKALTRDNAEAFELLEKSEKAIVQVTSLTHQLLTFAKGGEPVKKISSVAHLVREAALFAISGSNCKAEFSIAEGVWAAEVDPGQVRQVVENIVINAKQVMANGGIITIAIENAEIPSDNPFALAAGAYAHIAIEDHGVGIPREHLDKVFDPYFTTKQKGSGLGLASAFSIVKKHNGRIRVSSEVGRGSVFHVYLPSLKGRIMAADPETKVLFRGAGRVLVMDDDEAVRDVLARMLQRIGYTAVFASHGEEAVAVYRKSLGSPEPIALVILDLTIKGGMGGRKALEELKKINPDIRALASSGYSDDTTAKEHKDIGFNGFLGKPYTSESLSRVIREALGNEHGSLPQG